MKRYLSLLGIFLLASCQGDWMDYSPIDMYSAPMGYDDSQSTKRLAVAVASMQPSKTDKQASLDTLSNIVGRIQQEHPEVRLVVFGEMILGWYWDPENKAQYIADKAEVIPGITGSAVQQVLQLAKVHNIYIAFGLAERDSLTGKIYNTQVLAHPDGTWDKYRKRNLNITDEDNGITAGDSLVIVNIEGIRTAMLICSDMQSAKITREISDAKVDLIMQSLTSTTDLNPDISYVGTQFNRWLLFANRYGNEKDFMYTGFSHIIDPTGTIQERTTGRNSYVYRNLGF